ncbi:aldo/keto reductase [Modestobacter sp. KNN46-3]|jgi:aryl-alcohol dehydrogenase-like predicted oxidoreductase|uniref:aldo/keto reductase n=1 Tax=Modestobacter sp. KNN46-3 TaxID=2711218 RepID=UPI0013DFE30D|nr:aldo/keto reductase [Modestobacter sp. KNN46-3]
MQYRPLGRTGVQVSPLCLGAMMFGPWGNDDRADSIRIIHRALDAGINFVDTADVYSGGVSEEIVGEALRGRRDDVVLATKFFMPMSEDPNHRGGSRRWIISEVENSLRRLGTDHIDLYQVHRPSPDTDVEETLGALTDLVRAGKVRYIGSSSYSASQIVEAQWASRERHLERFVTEQPPYSILVRGIEEDVLPTTQRYGMGTLTYSPLAGGWLSGRWRKDAAGTPTSTARPSARFDMSSPANQRKLDIVEELAQLAEQTGITLIEMAIAFVMNHPGVTSAIVGPRTMEQLESYLPAADITLSTDVLDRIDELVVPGVTVNPDDNSYGTHELSPAVRRR